VKAGHDVTVITCAPNFPKGEVYPGYRNSLLSREVMDGIRVLRVWTYITANEGFLKRILDYCSFMVSAVLASPWVKQPDVVIATSPQFFTACAGYMVGRMKHIPFVFELRDMWPESIKAVGAMEDSRIIQMLERVEMFLYRRASRIVSVTESFKKILVKRGIEAEKISVVTNGVDISRFHPMPKDGALMAKYRLEGKFVAGYVGTHGMAHGLETILRAAKRLEGRGAGDLYRFILLGDGARKESLKETAMQMGLENVIFIDSVPKEQVAKYWSLLDASIIHLRKTELFTTVIPSKLFECMGMGIPVLHGVAGESADIVEREGVGLVFEPENDGELCEKLVRLKEDRGVYDGLRERCLTAARNYDRGELARKMLELVNPQIKKSRIRDRSI
jgi:glycosyltransferase involved in cell wall biosynthesis